MTHLVACHRGTTIHKNISVHSTAKYGDVLICELESIRIILIKYKSQLNDQTSRNFFRKTKLTGTKPTVSNLDLTIVLGAPSRVKKQKPNDWINDLYHQVDAIIHELQHLDNYILLFMKNELMGIDGPLWEGGHNGADRS